MEEDLVTVKHCLQQTQQEFSETKTTLRHMADTVDTCVRGEKLSG